MRRNGPSTVAGMGRVRSTTVEIARDFRPSALPGTIAGGLVAGFVAVAVTISFAAIIFSGPLEEHLPLGIGLALFGSAAIGVITALGSGFRVALAGVQDNVTAILAVAVAAVTVRVAGDDALPTVLATIVVASGTMGLVLYLMGRLRVGGLVRFMPYPVMGGFLAATGILLVDGGWGILAGAVAVADLPTFDAAVIWVPGALVAIGMYLAGRFRPGTMVTPIFLLAAIGLGRLAIVVAGVGRDDAMERGLLFGPFPGDVSWSPRTLQLLGDADWLVVGGEWIALVTIAIVAAVSLLLYLHALEHVTGTEVDVDRELRVAGVAGVASGAGGGMPGFLYFSDSALLHRITGPRRGAALIGALVNAAVLLAGAMVLDIVPRAVIGGVVAGIGLSFVLEWLWDARRSMGRSDHALVFVIAGTTLVAGFLAAIGVGVMIAIALFVIRYSRVGVVRSTYSLDRRSSTVERTRRQREVLAAQGTRARVFEVRGFLFFGTATRLFDVSRLSDPGHGVPLRFAVFDLDAVIGADSSMAMAFPRFDRAASRRGVTFVFSGARSGVRERLEAAVAGATCPVVIVDDLDAALRLCEERILDEVLGSHDLPDAVDITEILSGVLGPAEAAAVSRNTERIEVPAGTPLIRSGDVPKGLFFVEAGRLRVVLERSEGEPMLLRLVGPGSVLGEVGLYRGDRSSATVIADHDSVVHMISREQLDRLERADPSVAAAVHTFVASVLAERVLHAERALRTEE